MKVLSVLSADHAQLLYDLAEELNAAGIRAEAAEGRVIFFTEEGEERKAASVIAEFICVKLRDEELRRLISIYALPKDREERALEEARELCPNGARGAAERLVTSHFNENDILVPEGLIRFRMPALYEEWALAAADAALDARAKLELEELCGIVSLLSGARPKGMGNMRLILLPDGSSVLSDDTGCRIECAETDERVLSALVDCFMPERLTVYDLSPNGMPRLRKRIREAFGRRAVVFVRRKSRD